MLETLLKPNTGASLSGCVRWTQPMDGVRVCDFDCALTVPPALACRAIRGAVRGAVLPAGRSAADHDRWAASVPAGARGTAAARRKCEEPFGRGRIVWR